MEFEEMATNSTTTETPPTNDTAELVTEVDEKNVACWLRRLCCGGVKILAISIVFAVLVVVLIAVLQYIIERGKMRGQYTMRVKCNVYNLTR